MQTVLDDEPAAADLIFRVTQLSSEDAVAARGDGVPDGNPGG